MITRTSRAGFSVPFLAALVAACSARAPVEPTDNSGVVSAAVSAPPLGTAAKFAILAGTTVTNTGATTIDGDLGVSPGLAVTGFPPGIVVGGTIHAGDATALQGQGDLTSAYYVLAGEACSVDLTGKDLGGLTLVPGVYCFSSSAQLTGTLVLDAQGRADATFVFKMVSTLTTASNATVRVVNGGSDCGVFWQVGSSAVLGTGTVFSGSVLALTSISLATGAKVSGRALARNGAVTMEGNAVSLACTTAPTLDAGAVDGAAIDGGESAPETGTADAATADSGNELPDTGIADARGADAGSPEDAGEDAGSPELDAGAPEEASTCDGSGR